MYEKYFINSRAENRTILFVRSYFCSNYTYFGREIHRANAGEGFGGSFSPPTPKHQDKF